MESKISEKIEQIKEVFNFDYLVSETENAEQIRSYYTINKIAYRIFHNWGGYLHMGISHDGEYHHLDLEAQANEVQEYISCLSEGEVLELGYGRGANSFLLAKKSPRIQFSAVDLSTPPLKKYSKESNLSFYLQDYHDLSRFKDGQFDIVFAIETLCHSGHKDLVLEQVGRILKPGGKFIIYDGYLNKSETQLTQDERLACILAEKGMVVNKFEELGSIKKMISANPSFILLEEKNLSKEILPSLRRFEKMAGMFFRNRLIGKLITCVLPEEFIRNALSGYLMENLIQEGIAVYYEHVLEKKGSILKS